MSIILTPSRMRISSHIPQKQTHEHVLVLPLKEEVSEESGRQQLHLAPAAGFYRLLIHAVCQFYGLSSKST
jgi:hypothetical protein